jgi:hypothetical protein
MKKMIIAAAVLALGLGVSPVLAASHSGGGSGHSSGHGAGQGAGHRMSATPEPEGATTTVFSVGSNLGNTDTPSCPANPHTLVCSQ